MKMKMAIVIAEATRKRCHLPRIIQEISDLDLPVKKKDHPKEDLPAEKEDPTEDLPVEKEDPPKEDLQVEKEDQPEGEDLPVKKNLPMYHQKVFVNGFSQLENAQGSEVYVL